MLLWQSTTICQIDSFTKVTQKNDQSNNLIYLKRPWTFLGLDFSIFFSCFFWCFNEPKIINRPQNKTLSKNQSSFKDGQKHIKSNTEKKKNDDKSKRRQENWKRIINLIWSILLCFIRNFFPQHKFNDIFIIHCGRCYGIYNLHTFQFCL